MTKSPVTAWSVAARVSQRSPFFFNSLLMPQGKDGMDEATSSKSGQNIYGQGWIFILIYIGEEAGFFWFFSITWLVFAHEKVQVKKKTNPMKQLDEE